MCHMYSRAASREKPRGLRHGARKKNRRRTCRASDTADARFAKYHVVKIVVDSLLWNRPLDEPLPTHFFLEAARFFLGFSTSASA